MQPLERRLLLAAEPQLVEDIVLGPGGSHPHDLIAAGGTLFFFVNDDLWKSDGTEAGTALVKPDVTPDPEQLTSAGGNIYFIKDLDLWESDGTAGGTKVLIDAPGIHVDQDGDPFGSAIYDLVSAGGDIYYSRYSTVAGEDHILLTRLGVGAQSDETIKSFQYTSSIDAADDVNGTLYFFAIPLNYEQLWKSNGTAGGTTLVTELPITLYDPHNLTAVHNLLYFTVANGSESNATELWRSDGTSEGTYALEDVVPALANSSPEDLLSFNGLLYFTADTGGGRTWWVSDGTAAGTAPLAGPLDATEERVVLNGTLFYVTGAELRRIDTAGQPSVKVGDFVGDELFGDDLAAVGGTLYLPHDDGANGSELWSLDTILRVDGTAGNDQIAVEAVGAGLQVWRNGQLIDSAAAANVSRVDVSSGDGDDVINCFAVAVPALIAAGGGNDRVAGGSDHDTIGGAAGKDTIDGGFGNDRLNGHGGHDRLFGNAGGDRLYGYDGNDLLDGGSSGDRFYAGNGDDTCYGQSGDDKFFVKDGFIDQIFGATGKDRAEIDATDVLASIETTT